MVDISIKLILDFAGIIGSKSSNWGQKITLISNRSYLRIRIIIVWAKGNGTGNERESVLIIN